MTLAQTAAETVVAAGGGVYVAAAETVKPATPTTAPGGSFSNVGYLTEDGVTFAFGDNQEEMGAWQAALAIRRMRNGQTFTMNVSLRQWNDLTLPVAFGGGAVSGAGPYTYSFPDPTDAIVEREWLIRWNDGTRNFQLWVPRIVVSDPTEVQLQRAGNADLPLSLAALQPNTGGMKIAQIDTDDAQFAAG